MFNLKTVTPAPVSCFDPPLKLNVFVFFPSYGGNGGISSEVPDIREWWVETVLKMKADPRVGEIVTKTVADTPITMTRNQAVLMARESNCHLLLMVDSDQSPNLHKDEPWFKPFWDAAFDEIYDYYQAGPLIIGAPYCGPPNAENVYVFQFDNRGVHGDQTAISLDQYTRAEARKMRGIQEVAALPTGLILFDMRIFSLTEPDPRSRSEILEDLISGKTSVRDADLALAGSWFRYEWENHYEAKKASTEDVVSTRDLAFAASVKLGYNPLRCAWDSWIGHWKPWNVGKPDSYTVESIAKNFQRVVLDDERANEQTIDAKMSDGVRELINQRLIEGSGSLFPGGESEEEAGDGHRKVKVSVDEIEKKYGFRPETGGAEDEPADPPADRPQTTPVLEERHWGPTKESIRFVRDRVNEARQNYRFQSGDNEDGAVILDVGPGKFPLRQATHFVGRKAPGMTYGSPFHELDLNCDKLPFDDRSVDFLYCRHVLEDLDNPDHLLREIQRVSRAGFVETPSPIAEATRGVDAGELSNQYRGYKHHRHIFWVKDGCLYGFNKLPIIEYIDIPEDRSNLWIEKLNESPWYWNTYYTWGKCHFSDSDWFRSGQRLHELDYHIETDYANVVIEACDDYLDTGIKSFL